MLVSLALKGWVGLFDIQRKQKGSLWAPFPARPDNIRTAFELKLSVFYSIYSSPYFLPQ